MVIPEILMDWAVEELRCLASYKATGGEWDEKRCREILERLMKESRKTPVAVSKAFYAGKPGWESEML